MAKKKNGKKSSKDNGKSVSGKASKRINVELAPGVARLLKERMASINEDPNRAGPQVTYADLVNEALDAYLPPAAAAGPAGDET